MEENKAQSISLVLRDEGSSLKTHNGDFRRFGLQMNDLCRVFGSAGPSDLKELSVEEAEQLLAVTHWKWGLCSVLSPGLDYFYFDTSVHCGWQTAARWLRELVGQPGLELDPYAVRVANRLGLVAIGGLEFYRRRRYKSDPLWLQLGAEWTNRCNRAKSRALKMCQGDIGETEKGTLSHAKSA